MVIWILLASSEELAWEITATFKSIFTVFQLILERLKARNVDRAGRNKILSGTGAPPSHRDIRSGPLKISRSIRQHWFWHVQRQRATRPGSKSILHSR